MDFSQLKQLYSTAELKDTPFAETDVQTYSYKNKWIHIPKKDLSQKEQNLLAILLNQEKQSAKQSSQSQWYTFLTDDTAQSPHTTSSIRMIQVKIQKKDEQFDYSLWLDSVRHLFDSVLDVFFFSTDLCLIIQNESPLPYSFEEFQGIFQTLEDDFSVRTYCYVGQNWPMDHELRSLLKEELTIFRREAMHVHIRSTSLADVALHYFTSESLPESSIIKKLKEALEGQEEWKELLQALWEHQGNMSVAAKSLYIHRNTLQYRMDKFYEKTQLSLKNMNELLLCYLLVL